MSLLGRETLTMAIFIKKERLIWVAYIIENLVYHHHGGTWSHVDRHGAGEELMEEK